MAALTREVLLSLKPRMALVDLPELGDGVEVYVREMNGLDVLEYAGLINDATGGKAVETLPMSKQVPAMQMLLERTLCDADGKRLFEDGDALRVAIPWAAMQRLWAKASEINKLDDGGAARKNSDGTQISLSPAA